MRTNSSFLFPLVFGIAVTAIGLVIMIYMRPTKVIEVHLAEPVYSEMKDERFSGNSKVFEAERSLASRTSVQETAMFVNKAQEDGGSEMTTSQNHSIQSQGEHQGVGPWQ